MWSGSFSHRIQNAKVRIASALTPNQALEQTRDSVLRYGELVGRVIHSNRHATLSPWIGGVAVFDRALSDEEMKKLATIGNCSDTVK